MKTAEEWIQRLDFGLFERITKRGADPLLWGETLNVIKQIQADAVAGNFERKLEVALNESVKLQAHYAKLLNMHDGGQRTVFKDTSEWMDRLEQTGAFK